MVDAHPEPRTFDHGRGPGSLHRRRRRRDPGVGVRRAHRRCPTPRADRRPTPPTLHRLIEFVAGEPVDAEYVPLVRGGGRLRRRRPPAIRVDRSAPTPRRSRASTWASSAPGSAGSAPRSASSRPGIPYTVFDKNADVGGTWFENTYPDLRVDVPNHFYSYSFRPNPDWSHFYARQHELFDYIAECAKEHHVLPHVRFGTEVRVGHLRRATRARWRCRSPTTARASRRSRSTR